MNRFAHQTARRLATTLGLTFAIGACHNDSANTAPLVGTGISADAASNNQTATAGSALAQPVAVHVTDQNGNPIANVTVTWTVVNHSGSTSAASSTTDVTGMASTTWTLDTIARTDSLTASIFSGGSATIIATGTAGAAANEAKVSGDSQTDASGSTSAPMVVQITDRYGNAVSGVAVGWVQTGGGTLSAASTTTDANGMTSVTMTLGATPGPYTVTASALLLAAVTFNVIGN